MPQYLILVLKAHHILIMQIVIFILIWSQKVQHLANVFDKMEVQQKSVKSAAVPEGAGWLKGNKKSQLSTPEKIVTL